MTLKTRPVTGTVYDPEGNPLAGISIYAELTPRFDTDDSIIVPRSYQTTADTQGNYTINLWPNARGVNGTQYKISILYYSSQVSSFLISVPDGDPGTPVPMSSIINSPPYPPVNAAQQAVAQAQAAALGAEGYASTATTQASIATDAATAAGIQAGIATGAADTATTQAGVATDAATTAGQQAGVATGAATTATTQAGIATGAAATATTQAGTATTQAGIATGAATTATQQATAAGQSATAAAASAASTNLPAPPLNPLSMVRVNAGATGYEARTPAQVLNDVAGPSLLAAINQSLYGSDTWPIMDVRFLGAAQLDPLVTWTRNGTKTYWDQYGVLQTAAINAPAFDHFPNTGAPRGVSDERTATNLITNYASGLGSTDGTSTGAQVADSTCPIAGQATVTQVTSSLAQTSAYVYKIVTGLTSGTYYAQTFLFKPVANVKSVQNLSGSLSSQYLGFTYDFTTSQLTLGSNTAFVNVLALSNGWYLFQIGSKIAETSTSFIFLIEALPITTGVAQVFNYAGLQLEAGTTPTSIIPTNGSQVARTADNWSIGSTAGATFWPGAAGSMVFDCEIMQGETSSISLRKWQLKTGTLVRHTDYGINTIASWNDAGGNQTNLASGVAFTAGRNRSAYSFATGLRQISVNGSVPTSDSTSGTQDVSGCNQLLNLATGQYNVWMRNIQLYPNAATTAQMQSRSTPT